jgi:hypothetical protein
MEGPMFKKTNETPKRANHKGNIKFPNPLISQEAYQTRKGDFTRQTLSVAHNLESWDMSTWYAVVAYGSIVVIICHSPCDEQQKIYI